MPQKDELKYISKTKRVLSDSDSWDVLLSVYNSSERVQKVFDSIRASFKIWIITPEYGYLSNEHPTVFGSGQVIELKKSDESEQIHEVFDNLSIALDDKKILIDITGMMRPQILFLLKFLNQKGIKGFDMIYTEPLSYEKKEHTKFNLSNISAVRQVEGFQGGDLTDQPTILIVGAGYDYGQSSRVVLEKEGAYLINILNLPSLSADMYQESLLCLERADLVSKQKELHFVNANDPYITAFYLCKIYKKIKAMHQRFNLYLSPLST
ncbi:MAG: hypothetical protein JHC54_16785, partial [Acinetobacter sp.]|nr:hypothetical protein [Acinetobacter sp.]